MAVYLREIFHLPTMQVVPESSVVCHVAGLLPLMPRWIGRVWLPELGYLDGWHCMTTVADHASQTGRVAIVTRGSSGISGKESSNR